MSKRSPYRPYTPDPEQMALVPERSGNAINGLGETTFRRASPVYWRDPDSLDHGALQRWFYTRQPDNPLIQEARAARARLTEEPLAELAPTAVERSAGEWREALDAFAAALDIDHFGVAEMRQEWLFEDAELDHRWVIVVGVAHDYEAMRHAPEDRAGAEVIRQYGRGIKAVKAIAGWFRSQGWDATPHGGPMAGSLLMIPAAIAAGFGELGRHGSIIHREMGSSFRLACVTTDAPLLADRPETYGVDDFCSRCQVCSNACPPDAIAPRKQWVRGELKWYVDFDRCLPFFNEHLGCGICVAVCPWSLPGRGPRIAEQLARRAARSGSDDDGPGVRGASTRSRR